MPFPNRYYNNIRLSRAGMSLRDWTCIIYPVIGINDTHPLKFRQNIKKNYSNDSFLVEIEVDKEDFYVLPKLTKLYADMRRTHIETIHLDNEKQIDSNNVDIIMNIIPNTVQKKIKYGNLKERMIKSDYDLTNPASLYS